MIRTGKKETPTISLERLTPPLRRLLAFTPLQYMFDAAEENPKAARIYANDRWMPSCCAVLMNRCLFIGGEMSKQFFTELIETIFSADRRKQLESAVLFYETEATAALFRAEFSKACDNTRSLYRLTPSETAVTFPRAVPIDQNLLESDVKNISMITEEILGTATYDGMDDFCRRGIGFAFIPGNAVRGICVSEYQSASSAAIGIEIDSSYRRQGAASELADAFLQGAAKQHLTVYWECWAKNEASVRTALGRGFSKVGDMRILFLPL